MNFENIEIRKVANGFIVTLTTEEDSTEHVFDTPRRALSFVKSFVDPKEKKDSK